jgi:hypothetical protein
VISLGVNTRDLLRVGDPTTTSMILLVVLSVPVLPVPDPVAGVEVAVGLVLSMESPVIVDVDFGSPSAGLAAPVESKINLSVLASP